MWPQNQETQMWERILCSKNAVGGRLEGRVVQQPERTLYMFELARKRIQHTYVLKAGTRESPVLEPAGVHRITAQL